MLNTYGEQAIQNMNKNNTLLRANDVKLNLNKTEKGWYVEGFVILFSKLIKSLRNWERYSFR